MVFRVLMVHSICLGPGASHGVQMQRKWREQRSDGARGVAADKCVA